MILNADSRLRQILLYIIILTLAHSEEYIYDWGSFVEMLVNDIGERMKYVKIFYGKILLTSILIMIQIGWYLFFMIQLTSYSTLVSVIFRLLSFVIILYLIIKEENSSFKIGWIILIMALPLLGGLLYLSFGNKRPSRRLRRLLDRKHMAIKPEFVQMPSVLEEIKALSERQASIYQYLFWKSDYPVCKNTAVNYYQIGEEMYCDMIEELEKAEHFIFLEYFIIEEGIMWDRIFGILTRKAAAGVEVRLIYDDVGSLFILPKGFAEDCEAKGVKCMAFNPFVPLLSLVINNRDHRKIMVIDGHTAFTGGINLADEYINEKERFGHWKDNGVRIKGEAVWNFTLMFLEIWYAFRSEKDHLDDLRPHRYHPERFPTDGYIQPFSDSPLDEETVGRNLYIDILNCACRYVYIFTPYLVIDNETKSALCMAAKRGVDVRIVLPGIPDKKLVFRLTRSYYGPLIHAGVRIYEYTPGFLHAKSFVCDDETAVVGTINMDFRSLYLHFECGIYMYRTGMIADLKKDFLRTVESSRQITAADIRMRFFGRLLDAVLRLVAPVI